MAELAESDPAFWRVCDLRSGHGLSFRRFPCAGGYADLLLARAAVNAGQGQVNPAANGAGGSAGSFVGIDPDNQVE